MGKPGHGGVRKNSGRPLGTTVASGRSKVYAPTLEKAELLSMWRAEVASKFTDLVAAQIAAATGVTHMVARDENGKWRQVTENEVMIERLNAGENFFRLTAVSPNSQMMNGIMDRMFGSPKQSIELDVTAVPAELSDADLEAGLSALLEKLRKTNA